MKLIPQEVEQFSRLGWTDATKTLKNNRKIHLIHRCYVKQKPSETQHFDGYRDTEGMKLGFTTFLIPDDDTLDLRGIW